MRRVSFIFASTAAASAASEPASAFAFSGSRAHPVAHNNNFVGGASAPSSGRHMFAQMLFDNLGLGGGGGAVVEIPDSAQSWDTLTELAVETPIGQRLNEASELRKEGKGPAHTDALVRLFDAKSEDEVRVTLYRDDAAWCPYCQKVWLLLEEKRIPFKVSKINMRSYGDKPASFLQKVRGGLLPAIELDGRLMTDSVPIMVKLDETFSDGPSMIPQERRQLDEAQDLMSLERRLFGDWCGLTFRPGKGFFGDAENNFLSTLKSVDDALQKTPGPWFLDTPGPTLVDLQYVSHVERMIASVLYWKGMKIRGTGQFKGLDAWFEAFEERPSYIATKSDYYTHCKDIPPQYGPGYSIPEAEPFAEQIDGASWKFPLEISEALEPLAPLQWSGEVDARHEAAWKLTSNHKNVIKFAARGAGQPGAKEFQAPLADPYAKPAKELLDAVDVALRHVAAALLDGADKALPAAKADFSKVEGNDAKRLAACLVYLRDRIGVPRDMGQAAAFQLRATLNWAIDMLS